MTHSFYLDQISIEGTNFLSLSWLARILQSRSHVASGGEVYAVSLGEGAVVSRRGYRLFASVFLLLLVEGSARLLAPYQEIPRAGYAARNPGHKYGWPEYVQGDRKPGRKLTNINAWAAAPAR